MRFKLFVARIASKYISKKYNIILLAADLTPIALNNAIFTKINCERYQTTIEYPNGAVYKRFPERYKLKLCFLADENTIKETYKEIINKIKKLRSRTFYIRSDSHKIPCGRYYMGTLVSSKRIYKSRSNSWYIVEIHFISF